jgi:hypothetical protein
MEDDGFFNIFNLQITLLNELFDEIPENHFAPMLRKFYENGFIDLVDKVFLR